MNEENLEVQHGMAIQQGVNEPLRELALFAGAGGGILGGKLLGWRTVCAVEIDAYAASVLVARQNDGCLEAFPVWDDVRTFDGRPWRSRVDVVSGGFPCQDISSAGKGIGINGERSGLWKEFVRIIGEVRPRFSFVENSPILTSRGLGVVLGDLFELGYDAQWAIIGGKDAKMDIDGKRIWIIAASMCRGLSAWNSSKLSKTKGLSTEASTIPARCSQYDRIRKWRTWTNRPYLHRNSDGLANRVDRLKAIGNGQVPAVARLAWETLAP